MDEFIKELDADLDYLEHEITADEVILYVASNRKSCRCPYCGYTSMRIHSRYEKSFQDLPIMGKKTKVIIENRKFFCDNPDCTFTTFAERFDILEQNGKKTKRLIDKIIDISLNTSSVAASRTLKDGIAEVGKSTICNLLKKEIPLPEKHSITKVCIDDFAFRKRQTYGTIMVDIDTHRVADLRASREVEDVAEWLRSYPNIRIVSRDGSVSYKSAIEQAGMDIQPSQGPYGCRKKIHITPAFGNLYAPHRSISL